MVVPARCTTKDTDHVGRSLVSTCATWSPTGLTATLRMAPVAMVVTLTVNETNRILDPGSASPPVNEADTV